MRATSTNGITFLEHQEGNELKAYLDTGDKLTIGTGHLCVPGEGFTIHSTITQEQSESLLKGDLKRTESTVNRLVKVAMSQNAFDALVCLVFNIGGHAFETSGLLLVINMKSPISSIQTHWVAWNKVAGKVSTGLANRRIAEFKLYNS